jgi:hypothetical protein
LPDPHTQRARAEFEKADLALGDEAWLCFKNDFAAKPGGLDENKRMQLPLHCSIHLAANWIEGAVFVGC